MVVKLLMKMEESVCSSKQLSVKDGEVIYSPYEEHYFFSPLIATALMKSLHTWGVIQEQSFGKHIGCGSKVKIRKADLYIIQGVCQRVCVPAVNVC